MRNFNVQLFEWKDGSRDIAKPLYMIALSPSGRGGQGTKNYVSKEAFARDLKRYFAFSDGAIARFFSDPKQNSALRLPLTDEDAAYLGWAK